MFLVGTAVFHVCHFRFAFAVNRDNKQIVKLFFVNHGRNIAAVLWLCTKSVLCEKISHAKAQRRKALPRF
jgi:hypothetical protein